VALLSKLPIISTGDFNVDLLKKTYFSITYLEMLQKYHLIQTLKQATHIARNTKTLVTHAIISPKIVPAESYPADHLPVITVWNEKKEKLHKKAELVQKTNYEKLTENFRNFNTGEINHLNYNDAFNSMHDKIIYEVEKCKFYLSKKIFPEMNGLIRSVSN
jgi:glutamine synthetase adenylyltransferase